MVIVDHIQHLYLDRMKHLAVFCGSSAGYNGIYRNQAEMMGKILAKKGIKLIYGGGKVGLMGVLADATLEAGGEVTGVIPRFMEPWEVAHDSLTQLIHVETMHERKALIHELSDGAIALPGGFGTLDELFEMLTWGQLDLHNKPVGVLNINGYFSSVMESIEKMVQEGFLKEVNRDMVLISENIEELLEKMNSYSAPSVQKWIT